MGLRRSPTIDHDTSVWPLHVRADNRDRACNRDRGHSRDRGHIDRDYRTPDPDWVLSNDQALVLETPGRLVREWVHFRGLICVLGRVIAPLLRTPQAETPQQPRLHKSVRVCEPFWFSFRYWPTSGFQPTQQSIPALCSVRGKGHDPPVHRRLRSRRTSTNPPRNFLRRLVRSHG